MTCSTKCVVAMNDLYNSLYFFFVTRKHYRQGKYVPIDHIPDDYKGYCYYLDEEIGVFIPGNDVGDFRESFSNVILESAEICVEDSDIRGLRLRCPEIESNDEIGPFTILCTSFLDTTEGHRESIISDPDRWCEIWRNTLGNKNYEKNAYPVVAELLLVEELLKKGYIPIWTGPNRGVNDVITSSPEILRFEVNSTLSRGSHSVKISEEFQAENADYLCFYRFEEVGAGGTSVNSLIERLLSLGIDKKELEEGLLKVGLTDTTERNREYKLMEKIVYPVDDNFPDIMKFFIGGAKPSRINSISYNIDLSGLETTEIPDCNEK